MKKLWQRDAHERQWIHETCIRKMSMQDFADIFREDMKNKNAYSEKRFYVKAFYFGTKEIVLQKSGLLSYLRIRNAGIFWRKI